VRFARFPGGKRIYASDDVERIFDCGSTGREQRSSGCTVIYARVSSVKQKEDLERQVGDLQRAYPDASAVYKDIGSGVNFKRQGLCSLLDACDRGGIGQVVVMHRDRLARIAVDLLEHLFER